MHRLRRLLPALWLLGLLLLPAIAWTAGERQGYVTNGAKQPFPPINRSSVQANETFQQIDAAVLDRLPLRERALQTKAAIGKNVFGDSSGDGVYLGRDDWLYFRLELMTCTDHVPQQPADQMEIMARTLVAAGYNAAVISTDAKMVLEREYLEGPDPKLVDCITKLEKRVSDRLAAAPGGLDIQPQLEALRRQGKDVFLKGDTHWNQYGREVYARALLNRIRPGMAEEAGLHIDPKVTEPRVNDLRAIMPLPQTTQVPILDIDRTPKQPGPPGSVVVVGDSQTENTFNTSIVDGKNLGQRVLPNMVICSKYHFPGGNCDDYVRNADTVVLQTVGRHLEQVKNWCWRVVMLAGERLPAGRRGTYRLTDESGQSATSLQIGATPLRVQLSVPGGDRSDVPRLVRLPLRGAPAQLDVPADGSPPPGLSVAQEPTDPVQSVCAVPAQYVRGAALLLPIPAGASLSQMTFTLAGPTGAKLGAPQEITLDGTVLAPR